MPNMLYDAITDYITIVDTNYRIIAYNKAVEGQFGEGLKGLESGIGATEATYFITGPYQDALEKRMKYITGLDRWGYIQSLRHDGDRGQYREDRQDTERVR